MNAQQAFGKHMRAMLDGLNLTYDQIELVFGTVRFYPTLQIDVQITDNSAKLVHQEQVILHCTKNPQTHDWRLECSPQNTQTLSA